MVIKCIAFPVFLLNVVVINSAPKMVNFSCDDNVMNLSYITIVSFRTYTLMLECFFRSMNERNNI
jgi:low affinity Fe/Cu permease